MKSKSKMAFLDVLIKKEENGSMQTGVYWKATNSSIHIHWISHAHKTVENYTYSNAAQFFVHELTPHTKKKQIMRL